MSKEYLEALRIVDNAIKKYSDMSFNLLEANAILSLEEALQRLEAIDNANPSEALECLERIEADLVGLPKHVTEYDNIFDDYLYDIEDNIDTIKQALLKAQQSKQYLKWEDLEFEHTPKYIDVKMNGNKYKLVVGYNVAGKNLAILRDGKKEYYFLECDKQLFNDLHLEVLE